MSKNLPARSCACGCGEQPKRGQFRQGHDAKLRSEYLKRIRDGEETAIRVFLDEWPSLAYPYAYTEAKPRAMLGQGPK